MESDHSQDWQLASLFLSLKVISEDYHLGLMINDETDTQSICPIASITNLNSTAIKCITEQLHNLHTLEIAGGELTDTFILELSLHIQTESQCKALASCFQGVEPNTFISSQSLGDFVFRLLWTWRKSATHSITCQKLIAALLEGGCCSMICEMIIRYFTPNSILKQQVPQASNKPDIEDLRFKFALTCIQILDLARIKYSLQKLAKQHSIGDPNMFFHYILERSSWINYDNLEQFVKNDLPELLQANELMNSYNKNFQKFFKGLSILQFSLTSTLPGSFISKCYLFHLLIPDHKRVATVWQLLEIKNCIAKKLDIPKKHVFINSVQHGSLIIEYAIEKTIWNQYSLDSNDTSVIWEEHEQVFSIQLDLAELLAECTVSPSMSGDSFVLPQRDSEKSGEYCFEDVSDSRYNPQTSAVVTSTEMNFQSYQSLSAMDEDFHIIENLFVPQDLTPKLKIDFEEFKRIIGKQAVPVTFCLVAATGLPQSGKTTILENVLTTRVKFKTSSSHESYINRKKGNRRGFSLYELCVLGGPPQNKYVWSYCTRRYGVIYSIMCGLIRHAYLAGTHEISDIDFILPDDDQNDLLVNTHFKWLMAKTKQYLPFIKDDKDKQLRLLNGLSLVNIMDIGVNKALYEFLPILSLFCQKSIWLNFFSLERDGVNLSEPPDVPSDSYGARKDDAVYMRQRSRLNYLLRFAALSKHSFMIAASKDTPTNLTTTLKDVEGKINAQAAKNNLELNSELTFITLDDKDALFKRTEEVQTLITKMYEYQKSLPLRWVFLRSLVISIKDKPMIFKKDQILAQAKNLGMNEEEEVDEFLRTFTDYGSILYMPQFGNLVIVDIWKFLEYLDNLFYPTETQLHASNLQTYGIITKPDTKKILNGEEENFMQVLIGFGMATVVRIKNEENLHLSKELDSIFECYYIPRARVTGEYKPCPDNKNFALIKIDEVHFPADIQTSICHKIIKKNQNVFLLPMKNFNVSKFKFRFKHNASIEIQIIYQGSQTQLQIITNNENPTTIFKSENAVNACTIVLTACCQAFKRKINRLRTNLSYDIVIPCCISENNFHSLTCDDEPSICGLCQEDKLENHFRHCWIKAAKKCYEMQRERDAPVTFADLSNVAQSLNFELSDSKEKVSKLAHALNISDFEISKLEGYKGAYLGMTMLMKWKLSAQEKATKGNLDKKLKKVGFHHSILLH